MSYAAWLNPSPISGSGDGYVAAAANSDNTGRNARSTTLRFKAANCPDVARMVMQSGKPESLITFQSSATVVKGGVVTLTLSGVSNSKKLTFTLGNNPAPTLELTLPATYTANGVSTTNGADISGDPGAAAEYNFSIAFTNIPANTTTGSLTCQVIVTTDGGTSKTCTVTQAAGDATLSVSPESVTLDWNAYTESSSVSFTVTSNTNWTVE